jgi:tetratricopeptide (TPR) repeat protein
MRKLAICGAAMLAAAAAAPVTAQPPQQTIQQQFDAASEALAAERWGEAERLFADLEARLGTRNARSLAAARVRRAEALVHLGRYDEAAAALRLGLPALPSSDPSLAEDRFSGHLTLGRLAELALDYREALAQYRIAEAIAVPPELKIRVYRGLVQTQMFHDAPAALAAADEALRIAAAAAPSDVQTRGLFTGFRGRALLNMGRFASARRELERATQLLGGLGLEVDLGDLIARSDLAVAAMLDGDETAARRYMALTGAGRTESAILPIPLETPTPPCGADLSPADAAVVELSILDDGTVGQAIPIYSSRPGDAALIFARAAKRWTWTPQSVRAVQPLFRAVARVQLRCSASPRSHVDLRDQEIERWSAQRGIDLAPLTGRTVQALRAILSREEARLGASAPQLLPALTGLSSHPALPPAESAQMLRRSIAIASGARAPAGYVARLALQLAPAEHSAAARDHATIPDFAGLAADPLLRGNSHVVAALRLARAEWLFEKGHDSEAAAAIAEIRAMPELISGHPLMPEVLDLMIALESARGDRQAAAAAYRELGDRPFRCNVQPRWRRSAIDQEDYPNDASRWGFEGWLAAESTVGANGVPIRTRTVAAYPPFLFNEAAETGMRDSRFEPVFVPETGACATRLLRIIWRLPR